MSLTRRSFYRVVVGFLVLLGTSWASAGVIVYDNTSTPTTGTVIPALEKGFWPFSQFHPYEFQGDSITLARTERTICRFVLMISSSEYTVLDTLTVRFYSQDGPWPASDYIWSATTTNVVVDGPRAVVFDIEPPYVVVPDDLTWAASANSLVAGLATYDPPTVGYSPIYDDDRGYWFDLDDTEGWIPLDLGDDMVANFGCRLVAIPEPATALLLVSGALFATRRRR